MMPLRSIVIACLALLISVTVVAQDQKPEPQEQKSAAPEQKPEVKKYLTPTARMIAAKTVFMRSVGGNDIPFEVIKSSIESWGRYMIVDSPEKADLIMEVFAPQESTGGSSVSTKVDTGSGHPAQATTGGSTGSQPAVMIVKMTVFDGHSKVALWSASEKPKNAWKERVRQESQVECARKLATAFHERVEPQTPQPETSSK
jgi:hypothetical protein